MKGSDLMLNGQTDTREVVAAGVATTLPAVRDASSAGFLNL